MKSVDFLGGKLGFVEQADGDDYISISGDRLNLLHNGDDFSLMARFRVKSSIESVAHNIFATSHSGSTYIGFSLRYRNDGANDVLRFTVTKGVSATYPVATHDIADPAGMEDKWVTVCITRDSGLGTPYVCYVNGVATGGAVTSSEIHTTSDSQSIGRIGSVETLSGAGATFADGAIDIQQLYISDEAFSAAEVLELYQLTTRG